MIEEPVREIRIFEHELNQPQVAAGRIYALLMAYPEVSKEFQLIRNQLGDPVLETPKARNLDIKSSLENYSLL